MSEIKSLLPLEVPRDILSAEALQGVIDAFILREGTDYGAHEVSLVMKRQQIERQIEKAEIKIVFDPATESVTLLTQHQWCEIQRQLFAKSSSVQV